MNETKLPPDILRKIFQLLDDEDIEKISKLALLTDICSSQIFSSVCNDSFWIQRIMNKFGLTPDEISQNKGNDIRKYYDRLNKLTKEKFEAILSKTAIASKCLKIDIYDSKDLYDLLYQTDDDHDWGVIRYFNAHDIKHQVVADYLMFADLKNFIDEDNLKTRREILNEIKDGQHQEMIREFCEYNDVMFTAFVAKYGLSSTMSNYVNNLNTLETKLQDYIIEHTEKDVRKQIKEYQSNIADYFDEALYDDEQVEALQILHEAIRGKKLSIFDPLIDRSSASNYDYIIRRI